MNLMNLGRVGLSVLEARLFNKRRPVNVMWRITNKCNSNCSYCNIYNRNQQELSTVQIMRIIGQLSDAGTRRIGFVGGEALLRKDFGDIVDCAKSKNILVTLVTNGYLVPDCPEVVKKLDYLIISFDGRAENHEKNRPQGSHRKVINAFDYCKKHKIKVLTNTVINKNNLNDLKYIVDTVNQYGMNATFNVLQGSDEYPSQSEYNAALKELLHLKRSGAPIVLSENALKFLLDWQDYTVFFSNRNFPGFKCWAGELIFNIDTDGTIAACDIMTHLGKDNPNVLEMGIQNAIKKVGKNGCKACTCSHIIEYSFMFSMKFRVISDWMRMVLS